MSLFVYNLDISDLEHLGQEIIPTVQEALQQGLAALVMAGHAHLLENVKSKLHSRREIYENALSVKQENADTWLISLDSEAFWIEDGMEPHNMLDALLRSPKAKTTKDGHKYLVVPFKHNQPPTSTPAGNDLTAVIKSYLRHYNKGKSQEEKIPYGKIERNPDGTPKLGLLHKFDIKTAPIKTHEGAWQGHGPIGQVKQGHTGVPFLQGIRIYQRMVKNKMDSGVHVQRDIMTFRVASSKQKGKGVWDHPGLAPFNGLSDTVEWCQQEWDNRISDQIISDVLSKI